MTPLAEQTLWGLWDQPAGRDDYTELVKLRHDYPSLGFLRLPGSLWIVARGRELWGARSATGCGGCWPDETAAAVRERRRPSPSSGVGVSTHRRSNHPVRIGTEAFRACNRAP